MDAAEYRAAHGLPTSQALISPELKKAKADAARAQYVHNQGLRTSPRNARWRRRVRTAVRAAWAQNRERPGFVAVWRQAIVRAAQTRSRNTRQQYDRKSVSLGYRDLPHLLAQTWSLTDAELGQLLEVSESNAGHVRNRYGDRPDDARVGGRRAEQYVRAIDRRYEQRARKAGYRSIAELLHRTRSLLTCELAELLGVSVQAASRLRTDPSMARLRPGRGDPIEPTAALRKRRAERNKGAARPRNGDGQRAWWNARHEAAAHSLGYASLEAMVGETIELTSTLFGRLLRVSDDTASQLRRAFSDAGHAGQPPITQAVRAVTQMRYDARARNLGYSDMDHLLRETRQLTLRQLQDLLGVSMGTTHRLRSAMRSL